MTSGISTATEIAPLLAAFEAVPDPVLLFDRGGTILGFNSRAKFFYGLKSDDIGTRRTQGLDADVGGNGGEDGWDARLQHKRWWEGRTRRIVASGIRNIWIKWHIERDAAGDILWIVETSRDADHYLLSYADEGFHRQRYASMFNTIAIGFLEIDFRPVGTEMRKLYDAGVTDLRGYLADNPAKARELTDIAMMIDANAPAIKMFDGESVEDLLGSCAKFWPDESLVDYVEGLALTMERQSHYIREVRLSSVKGRPLEALLTNAWSPESARRGIMLMGVVDLTERNLAQRELDRVRGELAHAARVAMLGEVGAAIAHEVSQPLTAIQTISAAARQRLNTGGLDHEAASDLFERVLRSAQRANDVVTRLRAMASPGPATREPVRLDHLASEALRFIGHEIKGHAARTRIEAGQQLVVDGDPIQLQQVIINLLLNALQACAQKGVRPDIAIIVRPEGEHMRLIVEDNGPGIAPDVLPRIFESFVSTKASGMGMGLSICRGIMTSHGGRMLLENLPDGAGARIGFELPARAGAGDPAHLPPADPIPA